MATIIIFYYYFFFFYFFFFFFLGGGDFEWLHEAGDHYWQVWLYVHFHVLHVIIRTFSRVSLRRWFPHMVSLHIILNFPGFFFCAWCHIWCTSHSLVTASSAICCKSLTSLPMSTKRVHLSNHCRTRELVHSSHAFALWRISRVMAMENYARTYAQCAWTSTIATLRKYVCASLCDVMTSTAYCSWIC